MRRPALLIAGLLLPASLALAQTAPAPADPVLARVDGAEIRASDLAAEAERLPAELRGMPPQTLFPLLLDQMIAQQALVTAARARGLDRDPEVRARVRRAEEETLAQTLLLREIGGEVSEEALRARYQREIAGRPAEEEVRARHILVATEAEARTVLADLRRPGADFAEIARRRSTDPGARNGGDLGFFKQGDMVAEFAEAAFGLRPGETSTNPVRTQFGWHVIRVEERRAVAPPSFEEARESIRQTAFEQAVTSAVERFRNAARVERFNMDGTPVAAPSLLDGAAPPAQRR